MTFANIFCPTCSCKLDSEIHSTNYCFDCHKCFDTKRGKFLAQDVDGNNKIQFEIKKVHDALGDMCGTINKNKKTQDLITKKVMAVIFVFLVCNITCQSVIFGAMYFGMCKRTLAVSLFDFRSIFKKMIKPEPSSFDSEREPSKKFSLVKKESLNSNPSIRRTPTVQKAKHAFLTMK